MFRKTMIKIAVTAIAFISAVSWNQATVFKGIAPLVSVRADVKKKAVCLVDKLNVRADAGTTFPTVIVGGSSVFMTKDQEAEILSEKNGWYQVRFLFGTERVTGYVIADYVEKKEEKTGESAVKKKTTGKKAKKKGGWSIPGMVNTDALKVRKDAGTTFEQVKMDDIPLLIRKNDGIAIIGFKKDTEGKLWYKIRATVAEKEISGYVLSDFVKLSVTKKKTVSAKINAKAGALLREKNTADSKIVKNKKGKKIKLLKGKTVEIFEEPDGSEAKYFRIKFSSKKESYTGYVLADELVLSPKQTKKSAKKGTTNSSNKKTDETKPKDPKKDETKPVDPKPEQTAPEKKPDETKKEDEEVTSEDASFQAQKGIITGMATILYNEPSSSATVLMDREKNIPIQLPQFQEVKVRKQYTRNGVKWYLITYEIVNGNGVKTPGAGFVTADQLTLTGELVGDTTGFPSTEELLSDEEFERTLISEGFPEDYRVRLMALHTKYPQWKFQVRKLSMDWEDAVKGESKVGLNLIYNSKNVAWKSLEKGAYQWKTDSFIAFDGSDYVTVSEKALRYYMDPRNFLDEENIYQFELLSFNPMFHTEEGIEKILLGSPMSYMTYSFADEFGDVRKISYAETFLLAGVYSGVSPYHLASKARQEVAGGGKFSASASGIVTDYFGLYNFYNIGANDSTLPMGAVINGLRFAKNGGRNRVYNETLTFHDYIKIPWNNRYRSIIGGAAYIGNNYINKGQDTVYLEKFNLTENSTFLHQYMSNVEGPYREAAHIRKAYKDLGKLPLVFSIPVFNNMPAEVSPIPEKEGNPNHWLSALSVRGYVLTPSFSPEKTEYSIVLKKEENYVKIFAEPVNKLAMVYGTGEIAVAKQGETRAEILVQAENGSVRTYVIRLAKEQ